MTRIPAFTQIRNLTESSRRERASGHTAFFSYGENFGRGATMPDDGFDWQPTRQPIVLDAWPVGAGPQEGSFTTVMQWDSYRALEYGGRRFGMKSDSFRRYLDLPGRTGKPFEIAVGGATADGVLSPYGWTVRQPIKLLPDLPAFQRFLERSKAEFTVAKHGYTATRSGWFSDRSAAYLASGRPVVTEETGFSDFLPVGDGLLAFESVDEAVACILDVGARYEHHCRVGAGDCGGVLRFSQSARRPPRARLESEIAAATDRKQDALTGVTSVERRPRIAFFGYPDVFEDFYPHYGVSQQAFSTRWSGSGNHAFVSLLQREVGDVVWYESSLNPEVEPVRHEIGCRVDIVRSSWIHRQLWSAFYRPRMAWRWRAAYPAYAALASYAAPLSFPLLRTLRRDRPDVLFVQDTRAGDSMCCYCWPGCWACH